MDAPIRTAGRGLRVSERGRLSDLAPWEKAALDNMLLEHGRLWELKLSSGALEIAQGGWSSGRGHISDKVGFRLGVGSGGILVSERAVLGRLWLADSPITVVRQVLAFEADLFSFAGSGGRCVYHGPGGGPGGDRSRSGSPRRVVGLRCACCKGCAEMSRRRSLTSRIQSSIDAFFNGRGREEAGHLHVDSHTK